MGLHYAISHKYTSHNHCLSSLSATRVTTLWSKRAVHVSYHNLYSSRGSGGGTDPVTIPYRLTRHKMVHVAKVTICPHLLLNLLFITPNLLWCLGLHKLDYSGTPLNGYPSSNSKRPQYNVGSQSCPLLRGFTVLHITNTPIHNLVPWHPVLDRFGQSNEISAFWGSFGILNHVGRQSFLWKKIICNEYQ